MATLRTDDPIADFNRRDHREAAWLKSLPKCIECKDPIQDDEAVKLEVGYVCLRCVSMCREAISE